MGEPTTSSATDTSIDALLEERARYEQWLAKLDEAGRNAAEGVRDRIRQDYRSRLDHVLSALREHAATIHSELSRHREEEAKLNARRTETRERLSEAELRHAVGEFGPDEWQRISGEASQQLGEVDAALSRVAGEIARLAEVEQLIQREPAAAPASAMPAAPERPSGAVPELDPTQVPIGLPDESDTVLDEASASAELGMPDGAGHTGEQGDEMAFLRSVTDSEPAPAASQPAPAPPPAPTSTGRPAPIAPNGAAVGNRTLKCGECQTMNRPTEWYCERCGAELSAL